MGRGDFMIGADITDIRRIGEAIKNERFLQRVFTSAERDYAFAKHDPTETFAGIFAAKEAIAKLSGKGLRGFSLTDLEITHTDLGAPQVSLHGKAKEIFTADVYVSISHEKEYAFAVAEYEPVKYDPVLPGKEITDGDFELLKRNRFTHKGDYGRVYVIGGSSFMIGAPLICAEAAVKSGSGLTTLCVPLSLLSAYQCRVKEIMLYGIRDKEGRICLDLDAFKAICNKADVIAIGMGMGQNADLKDILKYLFANFHGTLVCDADAVNSIAEFPEILFEKRNCRDVILTPHIGEYQRLSNALGIGSVEECALKTGSIIACKSAYTLVSDGINSYKITSGCAAMAKGGSGDALAGIIAAYSCRTTALDATALACHYFGRCGEKASLIKGENAVTASDIIKCL